MKRWELPPERDRPRKVDLPDGRYLLGMLGAALLYGAAMGVIVYLGERFS